MQISFQTNPVIAGMSAFAATAMPARAMQGGYFARPESVFMRSAMVLPRLRDSRPLHERAAFFAANPSAMAEKFAMLAESSGSSDSIGGAGVPPSSGGGGGDNDGSDPKVKAKAIRHIFRGIPEHIFDLKASSKKNLTALQADFGRLGIDIHPSCRIANSTLEYLVKWINEVLSPSKELTPLEELILGSVILDESATRIGDELIESHEKLNFNIRIEEGVVVGEDVKIWPSVSIGRGTVIGRMVEINTGTRIGKNCKIGSGTFLNLDCSIGDNSSVGKGTTFKEKTIVPANSLVVPESDDCFMAVIKKRLRTVE